MARRLLVVACFAIALLVACTSGETPSTPTPSPSATATATMTSTASPTPTASPSPTATATPAPDITATATSGMGGLRDELTAAVEGYPVAGQYAFALTDLQTGEMIGVHADEPRLGACVMNFFVLLKVVHDIDQGRYAMTDRIDGLIAETIYSSNATTAGELWAIAGNGDPLTGVAETARYLADDLGIDGVLLDHPPLFPEISLCSHPDNWVTARATNEALARLYRGELLSPEWTDYLLTQMTNVKEGLNYLTACCNGGTTSHKNGFFPYEDGYVDNDVGIVRFWRSDVEYAYAVSFFSMAVEEKYADIPLAQDLMSRAWAWFDWQYP